MDYDSDVSSDYNPDIDYGGLRSPAVYTTPVRRRFPTKQVKEADLDPLYEERTPAYRGDYDYELTSLSKVLLALLCCWIFNWACNWPLPRSSAPGAAGPPDAFPGTELAAKAKDPLDRPYRLNFTAEMAPFWGAYRDVLASARYEGWFDGVDAAGAAIDQLMAGVPPSRPANGSNDDDEQAAGRRTLLRGLVARRAASLDLARHEYDVFLATRARQVREMLGTGSLWRAYVEDRFLGPGSSNSNNNDKTDKKKTMTWPAYETTNYTMAQFDNQTYAALTLSARRMAEELAAANRKLWKPGEVGLEAIGRAVVHVARAGEDKLVPLLLEAAPARAHLWTREHAAAMRALVGRMERARWQYEGLRAGMEWFVRRFAQDLRFSLDRREDLLVWVQSAAEIVRAWAELLMDTQEGVLISLRRKELAGANLTTEPDYHLSWEEWKSRNCGETSCYDGYSVVNVAKSLLGRTTKPLAYVARDERKWSKEFGDNENGNVWSSVYEKACCETGTLASLLKYGSAQTVE
ncbi:hypothetical protein F5X96DRAFT_684557 [Biscogniauxia mediterranea]|nr:hypothetical protein F5X96DRAFT_684557 [Biscogniauxia mediterranea]